MAQQTIVRPSYDTLANAPREIRTAANIALLSAATSRTIGILTTTIIIALLPTWIPGLLTLQTLPVALLVLAAGSLYLARTSSRNRERIAARDFQKARSSTLLATITGLIFGIIPGILNLILYTRIGQIIIKKKPDDPLTAYLIPPPSNGLFLGRYLGWLTAYLLVLYIGYTQLPPGLANISNWLSPTLGVHFNTLIVAAYLTLANPLTYPPLLQLWATAGFLGGIIAGGRVGRGFYVGLTAFMSCLGAMSLAALAIALNFNLAIILNIPPPPPGFSLSAAATGPVTGDFLPLFLRSNSPTDPAFIQEAVLTLIRNAGLVLAVVTLSGRAACLLWQGGHFLAKKALSGGPRGTPTQRKKTGPTEKTTIAALLLIALSVSLLAPTYNPTLNTEIRQAPPIGPYQQNLLVGLDMLGAPNASLRMANLDLTSKGIVMNSNYANANFSFFLINNNYPEALGNGPQSFMLRLFSQPVLVTLFTGSSASNNANADAIANQFSQALGTRFTFALGLPTGQGTAAIYSPSPTLTNTDALKKALALLPSASFASLVNVTSLANEKYSAMVGLLPALNGISTRSFGFLLGTQYPRLFFKQGPHQLSLKTQLGFQNSITADPAANVSTVTIAFEKGTVLYSPLAPNPFYDNSTSTYNLNATTTPVSDFTADFAYPFAPKIVLGKTIDPPAGKVGSLHTITVKLQNLDSVAVNNLDLTDNQTSQYYQQTLGLNPQGPQKLSLANFPAADTKSFSYTATPTSSGTYVLSPVIADFLWTAPNGTTIRYTITTDESLLTSSSGPSTQFSTTINDLWPYSLLLLLAFLIAPIVETMRSLRRRKKSPRVLSSTPAPQY